MADNVQVSSGTGNTIAADEINDGTLGTVKAQYIKVMDGTIDSTNKLVVTGTGAAKVDGSGVTQPVSTNVEGTAGSTPPTKGVLIQSFDGTNAQNIRSDTTGRQVIVGGATSGNAPAGAPVLMGASDGTLVRVVKTDILGNQYITSGGSAATTIAAGVTANTVVKASAGRITRVLVTATGTNQMNIYDNATTASGNIIGVIPANAAVGSVYDFQFIATAGITVGGNANNPGVTIGNF